VGSTLRFLCICALTAAAALPAAAAPVRHSTSPEELLAQSKAAAIGASSVRVVGTIPSGRSTIGLDMSLVAGVGGQGTLTLGTQRIDIARVGSFAYFRAGKSFWQKYAGRLAAQIFADRWVKVSASNKDFAGFNLFTSLPQFFRSILSPGRLGLGETRTVRGIPAVGLVDQSAGGGTLWIATNGKPFPLELDPPSGSGRVSFESWDAPMHVAAPANALDFTKLAK
jgi:hypothetical protein